MAITASGIAHFQDDDRYWDRLVLGDKVFPGVWSLTGGVGRSLDVKKSRGADGAKIKDEGYEPAPIVAVGRMIEEDDWATLQKVLPDVHPRKKGAGRTPLAIVHPAAQLLSIRYVYVQTIGLPVVQDGFLQIDIGLLEWTDVPVKKKKATNKPKEAGAQDALSTVDPPNDVDHLTNVPTQ